MAREKGEEVTHKLKNAKLEAQLRKMIPKFIQQVHKAAERRGVILDVTVIVKESDAAPAITPPKE